MQSIVSAALGDALGGEIAQRVRVGKLRAGVLQIYAADSVTLQELNFQKRMLLKRLDNRWPQGKVTDLRFRIQTLG